MRSARPLIALVVTSTCLAVPSARAAGPCADLKYPAASAEFTEDDTQTLRDARLIRKEGGEWAKGTYQMSTEATPGEVQEGLTAVCDARKKTISDMRDALRNTRSLTAGDVEKYTPWRGKDAELDGAYQEALKRHIEQRLSSNDPLSAEEEKTFSSSVSKQQWDAANAKAKEEAKIKKDAVAMARAEADGKAAAEERANRFKAKTEAPPAKKAGDVDCSQCAGGACDDAWISLGCSGYISNANKKNCEVLKKAIAQCR